MTLQLGDVFEAAAVGTIFPDERGRPSLHMHASCGRRAEARTGCVRAGVDVWMIGEVVVIELLECRAVRKRDPATGFALLEVD
jgi:predicted DNA-binding protein with PD1-like motif